MVLDQRGTQQALVDATQAAFAKAQSLGLALGSNVSGK
jgi:hypothetical protein